MKLLAKMTMYILHFNHLRSDPWSDLNCCVVQNSLKPWKIKGVHGSFLASHYQSYLQCSPFVWRLLKEIVSCWSYDKVKLEQESWWKALWESNLSTYLFAFSILLQARQRGLNFLQILQKPYCSTAQISQKEQFNWWPQPPFSRKCVFCSPFTTFLQ